MKRFKFYFDGVEVSNPKGWDKMIENMSRDQDLKGILITHDVPLEFTGDGYTALFKKRQSGFCSQTDFGITESCNQDGYYELVYQGILETSDMEFNLKECLVRCKINDNTFYAKINNNKNLECFLIAGKSKNLGNITVPVRKSLQLFNPTSGSYGTIQTTACFKWYDVFRYLISFITDDTVDFDSTLFGVGGDYENAVLVHGYVLGQIGSAHQVTEDEFKESLPMIKYQKFFEEVTKRLNLGFYFDTSGAKPKIWIEKYEDTKIQDVIIDVPLVKEIFASYFVKKLYSHIKLGTTTTLDEVGLSFPETIRFKGFYAEEFTILGKCNLDNPLDLQCDYITSSNVIQKAVYISPGDTTYDKNWFFIDCDDVAGVMKAKQSNWLLPGLPYFYNQRFNNESIANNYLGAVPNSIATSLGNTDNTCLVSRGSDGYFPAISFGPAIESAEEFADDTTLPNHDVNNRFNTSLFRYTAQRTGFYSFISTIHYDILDFIGSPGYLRLALVRYDSMGVFLGDVRSADTLPGNGYAGAHTHSVTGSFSLNANDYIEGVIEFNSGPNSSDSYGALVHKNSTFECTATADGGGVYKKYDPEDCPVDKFTFSCPLSRSDYQKLRRNILKAITFDDGKNYFKGWIDNLKYHLKESWAEFTVMANSKIVRLPKRCSLYNLQDYGMINRFWPNGIHVFKLISMFIDGQEYSTGQTLTLHAPADLLVGTGLDGNNYIQNISDWINTILPSGFTVYDNMQAIDFPKGSEFVILIQYVQDPLGFSSGDVYKYNNEGFTLPGGLIVWQPYTCQDL